MKTIMRYRFLKTCLWCFALVPFVLSGTAHAQASQAQAQASQANAQPQGQSQKIYNNQQLDQMLAPVALYPDSLLSQIFMATTYPSDVAEAAAWSAANPKAQGDDAIKQINTKPWDPSVQSLVAFPQVLAQMKQHPDWVQNMGDAFLAQPDDVMASVQRLRNQAKAAGNLSSTSQQKVVEKTAPQQSGGTATYIQIEPADPQVVYVPQYNPTVVYGTWPYPAYPPTYWPPPYGYYGYYPGQALAAGLAFGAGIAITGALWGNCNWGGGDVDINVNRYNSVNNVNNRISGNGNQRWNHNPDNRRGTPYRDQGSRQRFDQGRGGAQQREAFRGRDSQMDANRQRSLQSFDRSTNNGSSMAARRGAGETGSQLNRPSGDNRMGQGGAGERGNIGGGERGNAGGGNRQGDFGGGNRQAGGGEFGGRQQGASARNNAFSGSQSPGSSRSQMNRGQSSQRSMSQSRGAGGGGGRQMSRPAPSRGGGGGGRRRIGV
ncbi:DUF3300 domain-containing protein [Dyella telluris]|uniref:DUF3300 domain-containing protein n=1 Tax=Dyella telluris TaxID=2763498 RepID=UPI001EE56068|nr:DUF3300 domain-containing protein [Dyella telluris]